MAELVPNDIDFGMENFPMPLAAVNEPFVSNGKDAVATFTASRKSTIEISRDRMLTGFHINLAGTYTNTGTATGTARVHNPSELIDKIEVVANGKDTIYSATGLQAYLESLWGMYGDQTDIDPLTTTEATTINTAFPVSMEMHINLCDRAVEPEHYGALNARDLNSLVVNIYWGAGTSAIVDGANAGSTITATATVSLKTVDDSGFIQDLAPQNYGTLLRGGKTIPITATNPTLKVDLDRGFLFNRLLLIATTAATNNPTNAVITGDVRLKVNREEKFGCTAATIQQRQNIWLPPSFNDAGIYWIDFLRTAGRQGQRTHLKALDCRNAGDVQLELGVTTGTNTNVAVFQVMQRGPAETANAQSLKGRPVYRDPASGQITYRFKRAKAA